MCRIIDNPPMAGSYQRPLTTATAVRSPYQTVNGNGSHILCLAHCGKSLCLGWLAYGADTAHVMAVLQAALVCPCTGYGSGNGPGDARFGDYFHKPCARATVMIAEPRLEVGSETRVMSGVTVGGMEMEDVDGSVSHLTSTS